MFEIQQIEVSQAHYKTRDRYGYSMSAAKQAIMEIIEGLGQSRIGSGAFGVVYSEPGSDMVYKVCHTSTNGPYMSFVKQLSQQKEYNPYLPRIYGCAVYTSDAKNDSYFVVAMERLDDRRPDGFYDAISTVERLCDPYDSKSKDKDLLPGIRTVVPRELRKAVTLMQRAKRTAGTEAGWDLHGGNFMMRGDRQLVVIDPLA